MSDIVVVVDAALALLAPKEPASHVIGQERQQAAGGVRAVVRPTAAALPAWG